MRNEECVADIDLVRICQILTQKRKCDFSEIKQKNIAVYNNS